MNYDEEHNMGSGEVGYSCEFILVSTLLAAKRCKADSATIKALEITIEYRKILKELKQNGMKLYKKLWEEGKISDEIFKILAMMIANKVSTAEFARALEFVSYENYEELSQFSKLNLIVEAQGTELEKTLKKASSLRSRTEEMLESILPDFERKHPEKKREAEAIRSFFTSMKKHLDMACPKE